MKILSVIGGIAAALFVSFACLVLFGMAQGISHPEGTRPRTVAASSDAPRRLMPTFTPSAANAVALPTVTPQPAPLPVPEPFAMANATYRATETNDVFTRFSWQVAITNQTAQPIEIEVTAQFMDADGFVLDYDKARNVRIEAGQTHTVSQFLLINASLAPQVAGMQIQVEPR